MTIYMIVQESIKFYLIQTTMELFFTYTQSFLFSQWIFAKALSFCYLIAFASLLVQIKGLYGSKGILPIQEILQNCEKTHGKNNFFKVPSLFWFDAKDQTLQGACLAGIGFSLLNLCNLGPASLHLFCSWTLYLSFLSVCPTFLSFQWDILLLEVGFLAIFFCLSSPAPLLLLFALWFLLFRFMFSSGCVKLLSGCPAWKSWTAMNFHYYTQPIPNPIAWYIHQQPKILSQFSTLMTFALELIVPFLIFTPSPLRFIAFLLLVFLMLVIQTSGNYAFFNILSVALCLPLLEDSYYQHILGEWANVAVQRPIEPLHILLSLLAVIMIFLNALQLSALFLPVKGVFLRILHILRPFHLVNGYGLFARMTTSRHEIIVEGSDDGRVWKAYEFRYKPGDIKRGPSQVAPHQPRLDWQMWFAALGSYQQNPWYMRFLQRLLEGEKDVLKLLKTNPFPNTPPKYIRGNFYVYHFTNIKERWQSSAYWKREHKGLYSPVMSLEKKQPPPSFSSGTTLFQ